MVVESIPIDWASLIGQLGIGGLGMWLMYKIAKDEIREVKDDQKITHANQKEIISNQQTILQRI